MAAQQTSRRPYLVRAMHEWMTANNQTPHLVVDASGLLKLPLKKVLPFVIVGLAVQYGMALR